MHGSLKLSPDRCIMHSLRSLFSASKLTFSNPFPYFTSQQTFTYTVVLGILYNVTHNCTCSIIAMYMYVPIYTCMYIDSAWVPNACSIVCAHAAAGLVVWVMKSNPGPIELPHSECCGVQPLVVFHCASLENSATTRCT